MIQSTASAALIRHQEGYAACELPNRKWQLQQW